MLHAEVDVAFLTLIRKLPDGAFGKLPDTLRLTYPLAPTWPILLSINVVPSHNLQ